MKTHGDTALEWEGNLLIIHSKGPFNIEGILETTKNTNDTFSMQVYHPG